MAVHVADAGRAETITYRASNARGHGDSMPPMWEGRSMKIPLGLALPVLLAIAACAPQAAAPSASPTTAPTTAPTVAATVAPTPTSPIPTVPAAVAVEVPVKGAALLVLDITSAVCTPRASCVASLPKIAALIKKARDAKVPLIYSQTTAAGSTILPEVAPQTGEPSVTTRADKFFNTTLDQLMKDRAVTTAVIVGSAANGAVLYTAFGANLRGYTVVVAEDGISGEPEFSVTLTRWQLLNQPGFANADNTPLKAMAVTLSSSEKISFK
ncbi:MAG: cysteine hydrolase [Chloroflexi bacterium]|nr:MAG: cysteine hydrolase [Chloroflexota bacterium]